MNINLQLHKKIEPEKSPNNKNVGPEQGGVIPTKTVMYEAKAPLKHFFKTHLIHDIVVKNNEEEGEIHYYDDEAVAL